jgi:hypothetical protein
MPTYKGGVDCEKNWINGPRVIRRGITPPRLAPLRFNGRADKEGVGRKS